MCTIWMERCYTILSSEYIYVYHYFGHLKFDKIKSIKTEPLNIFIFKI